MRHILAEIGQNVGDACAKDAGQHDPEGEVRAERGIAAFLPAQKPPVHNAGQKGEGHHDAIPVDGTIADVDEDRMHDRVAA